MSYRDSESFHMVLAKPPQRKKEISGKLEKSIESHFVSLIITVMFGSSIQTPSKTAMWHSHNLKPCEFTKLCSSNSIVSILNMETIIKH